MSNNMDVIWEYDSGRNAIKHRTGFVIVFEGEPESDYFIGTPSSFPRSMSSLEIAALIREGFEFYRGIYASATRRRAILTLKAVGI